MTDRDDYKRLADELDAYAKRYSVDWAIAYPTVSWDDLKRIVESLRAASVKAGEVVAVKPLEWRPSNDELGRNGMRFETLPALDRIYHISETWHGQLGKVWQRGFDGEYFSTLDEAKAACQAVHDNRARSALVVEPVKGEPVAWLRYAVEDDAPKPCNEDDDGAFPVYRTATPAASDGAMREASPDDLRALGWSVAVHNDYRLNGEAHTFWLLTKDGRAIKGEGKSDAVALNVIRSALAAANQSDGGESFVTTNPDGSVTLDAYAGKTRVELKARCRELSIALNEWPFVAMEAATAHGNCLSNVPEHARAKIANMIEAYRDEDEPRPSDTPPAPQAVEAVSVDTIARICADDLVPIIETATRVANRTGNTFVIDRQKVATMIAGHFNRALLAKLKVVR